MHAEHTRVLLSLVVQELLIMNHFKRITAVDNSIIPYFISVVNQYLAIQELSLRAMINLVLVAVHGRKRFRVSNATIKYGRTVRQHWLLRWGLP